MVKIQPNYHQGIEFIQLSQLSPHHAHRLSCWLPQTSRFRVAFEDIELEDCVAYDEYEFWFETMNFETSISLNL